MTHQIVERNIGGRTLRIETGKLAKQAAGAVVVSYGDSVVLTAVVTADPRVGIDFFPLTVDYREKTYAAGKFPGGFFKREARPTQKEILTMRMIDRPIRPLFPEGFRDELLIQSMVLSADQENDPDILAMVGASAALSVSKVPFDGPIAACRIGYIDGEYVLNPTVAQMEYSALEMVLAGHKDGINMLEAGANEVSWHRSCFGVTQTDSKLCSDTSLPTLWSSTLAKHNFAAWRELTATTFPPPQNGVLMPSRRLSGETPSTTTE